MKKGCQQFADTLFLWLTVSHLFVCEDLVEIAWSRKMRI